LPNNAQVFIIVNIDIVEFARRAKQQKHLLADALRLWRFQYNAIAVADGEAECLQLQRNI